MSDRTWGMLLAAVALALFAIAASLLAKAMKRVRAGGRARGKIVGSEATQSSSSSEGTSHGVFYRPKVRFTASDGRTHTFVSPVGRGKPYVEGSDVDVTYDPANPADAAVSGFASNWLVPLAMAGFGVLALVTAWRLLNTG